MAAEHAIDSLLRRFPKTRPPLTPAHEKVYAEEYKKTRGENKPLTSKVSSGISGWMHRKVAAKGGEGAVLEIGAGTLNHLPHEVGAKPYDIIEPFTYLYEDHPLKKSLRNIYADMRALPEEARYQRIVSVAVLEHLTELPYAVAKSGLLLEKEGIFQAGIPAEGGFLWGLAWRCSTGLAYRLRTGLPYKVLVRHEHINTAAEILAVVHHFYKKVRLSYFPLPLIHASLFIYVEASEPDIARCREFMKTYDTHDDAHGGER